MAAERTARAALRAAPRWEAFCFGTRLTRLTRALATTDADEALRRASDAALDWDGGTRIGESIQAFLDGYGHAGLARGAVVVVCSDGLSHHFPDDTLREMLQTAPSAEWAARRLVNAVNLAGATDNATVLQQLQA